MYKEMSKSVVVSNKFSSLEVVDSAKFDNEIVFDDLDMVGTTLDIIVTDNLKLASTEGITYVLGGYTDGTDPISGSVRIGHSTATTPATAFQVSWDSATETDRIGAFGVTPVVRPTTALASATFAAVTSGITDGTATYGGYTVGQLVTAFKALGFLT